MGEWIAWLLEAAIIGQKDRQILFRYGNYIAIVTMDDGERAPPIALPRNPPVAQAVIDGLFTLAVMAEVFRYFIKGLLRS